MSRVYDKVTVPSYKRDRLAEICCDLCGKKRKFPNNDHAWGDRFDVSEVMISYRDGVSYPEGGSGTTTGFDVCPHCFEHKLVPWFIEQGATLTEKEWDF
ncbi:hypothetical protein LCGC14_0344230 [marine sediment metagenome]|uniref:Uncharacterized protein n=1 Tax=marine sediment metagenome TaxID=412755 RepID=A0A0F9WKD9_9ZZZZ